MSLGRLPEPHEGRPEAIYYITADSLAAKNSPRSWRSSARRASRCCCWWTASTVDAQPPLQFEASRSRCQGSGGSGQKLQDEEERRKSRKPPRPQAAAPERLKSTLARTCQDVRVTTRLVDSPRLHRGGRRRRERPPGAPAQAGWSGPRRSPSPRSRSTPGTLVKRLDGSAQFDDLAQVLFDQAVLAEGGHLEVTLPPMCAPCEPAADRLMLTVESRHQRKGPALWPFGFRAFKMTALQAAADTGGGRCPSGPAIRP